MRSAKPNQSTDIKNDSLIASNSRNELPIIKTGDNLLIDARILHQQLKVRTKFTEWIKARILDYRFTENEDYFRDFGKSTTKPTHEFHLSLDMAKELSMLERNEIGRSIRRYFIHKEKQARKTNVNFDPLATFKIDDIFTGLKPFKINNQLLWPYQSILRKIGFSTKVSSSHRQKNYGQHFLKVGQALYITEEFAKHLAHSRCLYANRIRMKQSQPLLPFNFGDTTGLIGQRKEAGKW